MAEHSSSPLGPSATLPEAPAAWRDDRASAALANRVDELHELAATYPRLTVALHQDAY